MLTLKLRAISAILGAVAAWSVYAAGSSTPLGTWKSIWFGSLAAVASCLSVLFLWILTLRPSPQEGVISVLFHLYFAGTSYIRGMKFIRQHRKCLKDPRRAQELFLLRVLKENGDTDYGRRFKLKNIASAEEFRQRHPLTTYEDYKPYVERVMAGEKGVMTKTMPDAFCQTSGTTGPSKFFPQRYHRDLLTRTLDVLFASTHELCPRQGLLQKKMFHYVQPVMTKAKSGGIIRPVLSLYEDGYMASRYTTPTAGFRIKSFKEATYIHILFALLDRNLGVFFGPFIGAIESTMKQLESCWEDIVNDIEHGTINDKVKIKSDIRSSLEQSLGDGYPERAGELRSQFEKGFDGIMKRVWPNLEVLMACENVGIWPDLKAKYAKGIPFVNLGYGNSEGLFLGLSPWFYDDNQSIEFWINSAFFEFIKLENTKESQPKTFFLDELEIGQEYELVFTQDSGLYRYRVGDVIRITGYHENCPTFKFLYRMGLMLNLRYEKMNQVVLKAGLQAAMGRLDDVRLVEYAVAESKLIPESSSAFEKDEDMPYYVIFLELDQIKNTGENTRPEKVTTTKLMKNYYIDAELRDRNSDYARLRREGAISRPRVHIVKPGTFEDLKQHVLSTTSTTVNQYKVPRRIRTVDTLNVMYNHIS